MHHNSLYSCFTQPTVLFEFERSAPRQFVYHVNLLTDCIARSIEGTV